MATITNVRQRIAEIVTDYAATLAPTYSTKAKVHRYIPRELNAAELPAFLILPADATYEKKSSDAQKSARLYLIRMYIAPLAHGISNELEEYAESWPDDFAWFMDNKPRLEDSNNTPLNGLEVISSLLETDGGLVAAQYPANTENAPTYLMIEWRLRVITRKWRTT